MENSKNSYEAANPVFNTAKMTSYFLAKSGNKYAEQIIAATGFDIQLAYDSNPSLEAIQLPNMIGQDVRYEAVNLRIRESGFKNILDIACGFSPRGLEMSLEGCNYVGGDLQMVVPVITPVIEDLAGDRKSMISYTVVDATNQESFSAAASKLSGPVCIVTEGLMPYLNASEKELVFSNVAKILKEHGGCYICPDFNTNQLALEMSSIVLGQQALEAVMKTQAEFSKKGDSDTESNMIDPLEEGITLMKKVGLNPEVLTFYPADRDFSSLKLIDKDKQDAFREALTHGNIIVARAAEGSADASFETKEKDFAVKINPEANVLNITLSGRVDSLTAPKFVDIYREHENSDLYDEVRIDMQDLVYISSAGLRVLMMIKKAGKDRKVTIKNVSDGVMDILTTTGFDSIFVIEER